MNGLENDISNWVSLDNYPSPLTTNGDVDVDGDDDVNILKSNQHFFDDHHHDLSYSNKENAESSVIDNYAPHLAYSIKQLIREITDLPPAHAELVSMSMTNQLSAALALQQQTSFGNISIYQNSSIITRTMSIEPIDPPLKTKFVTELSSGGISDPSFKENKPKQSTISNGKFRKPSESRIPLHELHARMGLTHDPEEARSREQHILCLLQSQGFPLGYKTWIRDTDEVSRRKIVNEIFIQTKSSYNYEPALLEVIIRRGAYYLMQSRLRRIRRLNRRQKNSSVDFVALGINNPSAGGSEYDDENDDELNENGITSI
ncbi:hypothetical protein V1514DRAFT_145411 [Lipomyces japonicus]|uniref:uncharacterized protein n=1 Tax=Lipomyces japonicus TaxID=56871 RepID=UPI0034CEF445